MQFRTLDDLDMKGKVVLVRVDLNVPVENGRVTDATRIDRVLPTIRDILAAGGHPVLMAHFGRPGGRRDDSQSLAQVKDALAERLDAPLRFAEDCIGGPAKTAVAEMKPGEVLLLENTRFHEGEEANDEEFAASLGALGELYVNDAFSAAHRAHASTAGLARILPAAAGRAMEAELRALERALGDPARPLVAIVGGAKVSTKIDLLGNLVRKVNTLVIGGGMANTFLHARGHEIGRSLAERDMGDTARQIMAKADECACDVLLPVDAVCATEFAPNAPHQTYQIEECPPGAMILDAGPETVARIGTVLEGARTLIWNGPLGAFETPPFDRATVAAAKKAAKLTAESGLVSVAGGGDTVAALAHAGVVEDFTYVSTAGGAFLEWMEGKDLPGVAALKRR